MHDNTQFPLIAIAGTNLGSGRRHKSCFTKKYAEFFYLLLTQTVQFKFRIERKFYLYLINQPTMLILGRATYIFVLSPTCNFSQCRHDQWAVSILRYGISDQLNQDSTIVAPLCDVTNSCYRNAANVLWGSEKLMYVYCSYCTRSCSAANFTFQISFVLSPAAWQGERNQSI